MHNRHEPSFFLTNKAGLANGLELGFMIEVAQRGQRGLPFFHSLLTEPRNSLVNSLAGN
jgi:hypothetical protein